MSKVSLDKCLIIQNLKEKRNNKRKKRNYNFSIFQANDNVFKSLCLLNSALTQKGIYFLLLPIFVLSQMSSSIENEL